MRPWVGLWVPLLALLMGEVFALLLAILVAGHASPPCLVGLSHLPVDPFTALPGKLHIGLNDLYSLLGHQGQLASKVEILGRPVCSLLSHLRNDPVSVCQGMAW